MYVDYEMRRFTHISRSEYSEFKHLCLLSASHLTHLQPPKCFFEEKSLNDLEKSGLDNAANGDISIIERKADDQGRVINVDSSLLDNDPMLSAFYPVENKSLNNGTEN